MNRRRIRPLLPALLLAALALALAVPAARAANFVRLNADRLWLRADALPITALLEEFARSGVEIYAPTNLTGTLTGTLAGVELSEGLDRVFSSWDYLLRWRMMASPVGPIPRLASIRIIPREEPDAPTPRWAPATAPLRVSRGVSGTLPEHAADELLVSLRPGTSWPAFRDFLDQLGATLLEVQGSVCRIRFPPHTNLEAVLARLLASPIVARAQPNYVYREPPRAPALSLPAVAPPPEGSVPVAVLDSGVDPSSPAGALLSAGWNALSPDAALADSSGHGTQMALLAGGALCPDGWTASDAGNAVVGVRVFDAQGLTTDFTLLQALAYAKEAGARVVNMSWGSETESPFLHSALASAARDGLVLVAASGNEGNGVPRYPAAWPEVLAVAGTAADGSPWTQSSTGAHVALSAPATALGADERGRPVTWTGTSVSAAAVSSALADYFRLHPAATVSNALSALTASLDPLPAPGYGAGTLTDSALRRFLSTP